MEVADLWVTLRGISSEFTGSMAEAGAAAEETDGKIAGLIAGVVKLGIGAAVVGAGVAAESIKMASQFQASMELISTEAGVPQAQLMALGDGVLDLAGKVGTDPNSLAQGLYHIESSFQSVGITAAGAMDILKIAAEGARIGGADLVDVTNALDAAIASGIPGVQNYGQAMGALLKIVGSGDMTMQDLSDALSTGILATAKVYGASLTDVGAALATFGDNNIRGQNAATDLRMSIMDLTKQAGPGVKALEGIGIASGQLGKDMQTGGLNKALTDLYDHLQAAGDGGDKMGLVLEEAFTKKSSAPLAILLDQFSRLQSKYPDIESGANGFTSAWQKTQATFKQQVADLKAGAESIGIRLGEFLMPQASKAISGIEGLASKLKGPLSELFTAATAGSAPAKDASSMLVEIGFAIYKLIGALEMAGQTIATTVVASVRNLWTVIQPLTPALFVLVGGIEILFHGLLDLVSALKPATEFLAQHKVLVDSLLVTVGTAVAVWKIWTLAIELWAVVTKAAAAVQLAFNAIMDANPVMLVILAIAALAAGLIYAYEHSKTFRDVVADIGTVLKDVWTDVLQPVVDFFEDHWKTALEIAAVAIMPFVLTPLLIYKYWGDITSFFSRIWQDVIGGLEKADSWLRGLPQRFYNYIVSQGGLFGIGKKIGTDFINGLLSMLSAIESFFVALPGEILKVLAGAGSWLLGIGEDVISGLRAGFDAYVHLLWDFYVALPIAILKLLEKAPSWLLGIGKDIIGGLWTGIKEDWQLNVDFFTNLPQIIWNALGNADNWLYNIGKDVVQGLWDGISSMGGWLKSKISGFVTSFIGGVASFLGISSPSKVMADQIGRWIPPGIAQGIDGSAGTLHTSMANLMASVTHFGRGSLGTGSVSGLAGVGASVSMGAAGAAAGQGGNTLVINVQGTIIDPQGLYKAVQGVVQTHLGRNSSNGLLWLKNKSGG